RLVYGAVPARGEFRVDWMALPKAEELLDRHRLGSDGKRAIQADGVSLLVRFTLRFSGGRPHPDLPSAGKDHKRLPLPVDVPVWFRLARALRQILADIVHSLLPLPFVLRPFLFDLLEPSFLLPVSQEPLGRPVETGIVGGVVKTLELFHHSIA